MVPIKEFRVEFVQYMPNSINQGVLYVSMQYSLVLHLCACGCSEKVATPLSPDDWNLLFDGETVSLYPSIGNWDFPCESHYWIRRNKVITAGKPHRGVLMKTANPIAILPQSCATAYPPILKPAAPDKIYKANDKNPQKFA